MYPLDIDHHIKVAEVLCTVEKYEEAAVRLQGVEPSILEQHPNWLFCLGVALYHTGCENRAIQYWQRASMYRHKRADHLLQLKPLMKQEVTYSIWG